MPPKKRKTKNPKKEKLSQVDRTFYELTINDLNLKINHMRAHMVAQDESNVVLAEKLHSLDCDGDRTDVASHLERQLIERNDKIEALEEQHIMVTRLRDQDKKMNEEKIQNLEYKYKAMHDQLTAEIRMLIGKLNVLDEFRLERDELLARFEDQEIELKERDRVHEEDLFNMQQKSIVEKDTLKKEVETKLLHLSEEFTRASEIRNAGYTRRLIRENIALQKEIDDIIQSQLKLQQTYNGQQERHKEMVAQYAVLDRVRNELLLNSLNKLKIIEGLTDNYQQLKKKYLAAVKYREAYYQVIKDESCAYFQYKEASKRMTKFRRRVELLKQEKNHLLEVNASCNSEIHILRDVIMQIKITVQENIIGEAPQETSETTIEQKQKVDMLTKLVDIISDHTEPWMSTPSVMTLSRSDIHIFNPIRKGMLQSKRQSMLEIFKYPPDYEAPSKDGTTDFFLTAKARDSFDTRPGYTESQNVIVDVKWGTPLYVSSSREEEAAQAEEEPLDEMEGSSSSDSIPVQEIGEPVAEVSKVSDRRSRLTITQSQVKHSLGKHQSIPDVLQQVNNEEEVDDHGEEEDEYEINLFY